MIMGKNGGIVSFYCQTNADCVAWKRAINERQTELFETNPLFEIICLNTHFRSTIKLNCSFDHKTKLIVGTDVGLFVGFEGSTISPLSKNLQNTSRGFVRVLDLEKIIQIEVAEAIGMVFILTGIFFDIR